MARSRTLGNNKGELEKKITLMTKFKEKLIHLKLLLLIVCAIGLNFSFGQTERKNQNNDSDAKFELVFNSLNEKPKWLFDGDVCPFSVIPDFQKDTELLEESCSDNPEACLKNCKDGDGNSCYFLAQLIQEKKDALQDSSEALFLRSCKLGISSGCTNRAAGILNSKTTIPDSTKCVADTFEKTCERGDPWGCTMFGFLLFEGQGRAQNLDKALEVLSKSCGKYGEDDPACQRANELIAEIEKIKKLNKKKRK